MQVAAILIPMDSKKMGNQLMGWEKDNASRQQRGRLEVFKEAERRNTDPSPPLPPPPPPQSALSFRRPIDLDGASARADRPEVAGSRPRPRRPRNRRRPRR